MNVHSSTAAARPAHPSRGRRLHHLVACAFACALALTACGGGGSSDSGSPGDGSSGGGATGASTPAVPVLSTTTATATVVMPTGLALTADKLSVLTSLGSATPAKTGAVSLAVYADNGPQLAIAVALDADHGVEKAMDRELARGDRIRHRIDEEGHVVIDDADAHSSAPRFAPDRFYPKGEFVAAPPRRHFGEEFRGIALRIAREPLGFTWQCVSGQRLANGLNQRRVEARVGRH